MPMLIAGPGLKQRVEQRLVLNIDLTPTILALAGLPAPAPMHGRSLLPLVNGKVNEWRDGFIYEAPTPALGVQPILAARTARWKLIRTYTTEECTKVAFEELYDLERDPTEMHNLAGDSSYATTMSTLAARIESHRHTLQGRPE